MSAATTRTIVFAGGGTGGHLVPGIAVAATLNGCHPPIRSLFIGSDRAVERRIVGGVFEHRILPVEPSVSLLANPLRFLARLRRSTRAASEILEATGARAVIGLGGFASVPTVLAAQSAGLPTLLLEQNAVPGRATSWLCRRSTRVFLGFREASGRLPRRVPRTVSGNPVRSEIAALANRLNRDGESRGGLPDEPRRRTLLILGGSQGSVAVNDAVLSCVERWQNRLAGWTIVHQAGERDAERVQQRYDALGADAKVAAFFDDLAQQYRQADLAVARAGALTLSELACAAVPAIVIPHPKAVRDHQWHNARPFASAGGACALQQSHDCRVTGDRLWASLRLILDDEERLQRMAYSMRSLARPGATELVADEIRRILDDPSLRRVSPVAKFGRLGRRAARGGRPVAEHDRASTAGGEPSG